MASPRREEDLLGEEEEAGRDARRQAREHGKEEGLDGGIVEDEKLSAGNADIGSGSLASKHEEKFDKNSGSNLVEVYVHDLGMDRPI
ncbi:uncharacterized protein [Miscanthus floridulus]|uniref:uncharacterized protein isoform X4 n=1 Tax=Miscanthus floridulus TaxID=154761 RepID=UPI00345A551B